MPGNTMARRVRAAGRAFGAAASAAGMAALPGKKALHGHAASVECAEAWGWTCSVALEAALRLSEPAAPRWDAGVGLCRTDGAPDEVIVWIEPHPASSTGAVGEMLAKLDWLKAKLLQRGFAGFRELTVAAQRHGAAYRWLARTGAIRIRPGTREHRQLVKAGLGMPQRHLTLP